MPTIYLFLLSRLIPNVARDECAIDVVIEGPPIRADWYDLWGAAAIVVAVCARRGKDGVFAKTGIEFSHLHESCIMLRLGGSWRDGTCGLGFWR